MKPADAIVTMALVVAVTLAAARPAQAATKTCASGKIAAAGEYMDDALACYADAATTAAPCLQKAARKLTDTFAALERTGACQTTSDAVATMTRVDTSIGELLGMLGNSGAAQCRRQVLAAMGKDAERQHHCYADAVARGNGSAVEAACQSKATELFLADVTRTDIPVRPWMARRSTR